MGVSIGFADSAEAAPLHPPLRSRLAHLKADAEPSTTAVTAACIEVAAAPMETTSSSAVEGSSFSDLARVVVVSAS